MSNLVKDGPPPFKVPLYFRSYEEAPSDILVKMYLDAGESYYAVAKVWAATCYSRDCALVRGHHGACMKCSEEFLQSLGPYCALAVLYTWKDGT